MTKWRDQQDDNGHEIRKFGIFQGKEIEWHLAGH